MFISNYKPTSPARRWTSFIKGHMIRALVAKRVKNKFLGKQNETKKVKRSRRIGPSQKLHQTNESAIMCGITTVVVGAIKTARTNHINLITRAVGGVLQYRRAHQGYWYGQPLQERNYWSSTKPSMSPGTNKNLYMVKSGTVLFNVPFTRSGKSTIARAAGTFCKVLWHQSNVWLTVLRVPSKKLLKVSMSAGVTLGRNANKFFNKLTWGCAKKTTLSYKKVKRVRGVAMNPVDHPNGGRANTKQPLKNPWGFVAKHNK